MADEASERGAVLEAVDTLKSDVREIKTAILGPEGMTSRMVLVERDVQDLKRERDKHDEAMSEMLIAHRAMKWALGSIGVGGLVTVATLVIKVLAHTP